MPRKSHLKVAAPGRRVIVVYGPPGSGVTTCLRCISNATEEPHRVVPYEGPHSLEEIDAALTATDLVFVDVDGGIFHPEDVQDLIEHGFLSSTSGAVIRLRVNPQTIISRLASTSDRSDYINVKDLEDWTTDSIRMDEWLLYSGLTVFDIPNEDLENAVVSLALRSGLTR